MEVSLLSRKIVLSMLLALLALTFALSAFADGESYLQLPLPSASSTRISVNIPPENPAEPGKNPLTGEDWNGYYHPVMVQIDASHAALPHWGVSSADIMYEMPLHREGDTRSTALFMGTIPPYAGPVRSARVPMASLREMWGGAWVFYGIQEYFLNEEPAVDVWDFVTSLHPDAVRGGRWVFPFLDGTQMQYYELFGRQSDSEHVAPHNATINTRGVEQLFTVEPVMHPFKFTDTPRTNGTDVGGITISYKTAKRSEQSTVTSYSYDERTGTYNRFREGEIYVDGANGRTCEYANVIILYSQISWFNGNASRPVIRLLGQGTADIFQNGKWIRGMWVRGRAQGETNEKDPATQACRMVFLDENQQEVEMQRGKTFIQIVDERQQIVNVTTTATIAGAKQMATPKPTATPRPTRTPPPTRPPRQSRNTPVPDAGSGSDDEVEFGG